VTGKNWKKNHMIISGWIYDIIYERIHGTGKRW
jgi:hypothetical protein